VPKDDYGNLLKDIRAVVRKLDKLGKIKGTAHKKYLVLLYAATFIEGLKARGSFNKNDSYTYFSLYDLGEIARDKDKIVGHSTSFDKDTAKKVYQESTKQNFAKWLPREEISEEICNGDTSPIAITTAGKQHCETIITEYLDELPSRASQTEHVRISKYEQEIQDCGLNWLRADYFEFHTIPEKEGLENWKKGFSFELQSIKMKRELRRDKVIDDITTKLEREGKLLIVGESGSSKSTILMELMCDYFDRGFEILYNYGNAEIRNVDKLINLIEVILKGYVISLLCSRLQLHIPRANFPQNFQYFARMCQKHLLRRFFNTSLLLSCPNLSLAYYHY